MDLDTPLAPTAATAELRSKTQGARGTSPSSVLVLDAGAHSAASTPDWGRSLFGWLSTTYEAVVGLATPTAATAQQQQQHQQQPPPAAAHNGAAADPPPFTSLAPPPPQFHLRAGAHRPGARDDASLPPFERERIGGGNGARPRNAANLAGKPSRHRHTASAGAIALDVVDPRELSPTDAVSDRALVASLTRQLEVALAAAAAAEVKCVDAQRRADLATAAVESEKEKRKRTERQFHELQRMLEASSKREMKLTTEREQLLQDSLMLGSASARLLEAEATLRRSAEARDRLERENAAMAAILRGEDVHGAMRRIGKPGNVPPVLDGLDADGEAHPTCAIIPAWRSAAGPSAVVKPVPAPPRLGDADPLSAKLRALPRLKVAGGADE